MEEVLWIKKKTFQFLFLFRGTRSASRLKLFFLFRLLDLKLFVLGASASHSASMARCDACFLLLLRLSLCFNSEGMKTSSLLLPGGAGSLEIRECPVFAVTLVKTVRGDPDVTPVCSGATLQNITLMVCKIRTKWRREGCRVHYQHQQNFSSECGSRFRLVTENQTMFLQMTNLRVEDGGNHTCECSHRHGNDVLHLQVTVEEGTAHPAAAQHLKTLLHVRGILF